MSEEPQTRIYRDCPDCEVREVGQWGDQTYTIEKCGDHDGLKVMAGSSDDSPTGLGSTEYYGGMLAGIAGYAALSVAGYSMAAATALFSGLTIFPLIIFYLRGGRL